MIFITFDQLREHLDLQKLDNDIMNQAFNYLDCGHNMVWTDVNDIENRCLAYACQQDWDPDTTLVLFDDPRTKSERIVVDEDDAFSTVGSLNKNQTVCFLYKNLTLEKLADTLNRFGRMRVFS